MKRAAFAVIVSAGCMAGAGPTLGIRTSGELTAGWEATANVAALGVELGQAYVLGSGGEATYGALQLFRALGTSSGQSLDGIRDDRDVYAGAALGVAGIRGGGYAFYGALWPMYVAGTRRCGKTSALFTVQLGVRFIGRIPELYLAPKLNAFEPYCLD